MDYALTPGGVYLPKPYIIPSWKKIKEKIKELFFDGQFTPGQTIQFCDLGVPSAALSLEPFTFIGSCVSTGTSLNFGALSAGTVAAGDILVYIDGAQSGSAPTAVTPSDFATGINTGGVTFRGMVSTKKATGSEGAITGMNGATLNNKCGLVFRPSASFTTINMLDTASELTTGNPASQTCDPSGESVPSIVIGIADSFGGTGGFSTFSPSADGTVTTSDADMVVNYKLFPTSPAPVTIDMNDLGANWLASLYLTVS